MSIDRELMIGVFWETEKLGDEDDEGSSSQI